MFRKNRISLATNYIIISIFALISLLCFVIHNKTLVEKEYGIISHHTCAGKLRKTYKNCINIKEKGGFLVWDIKDATNDIKTISILKSGIIEIKYKTLGE